MKTFNVIYKPTGELVLDAAARIARERGAALHKPTAWFVLRDKVRARLRERVPGGQTTRLMNEVGFPAIDRALRRSAA
jgi:hypothetical protein